MSGPVEAGLASDTNGEIAEHAADHIPAIGAAQLNIALLVDPHHALVVDAKLVQGIDLNFLLVDDPQQCLARHFNEFGLHRRPRISQIMETPPIILAQGPMGSCHFGSVADTMIGYRISSEDSGLAQRAHLRGARAQSQLATAEPATVLRFVELRQTLNETACIRAFREWLAEAFPPAS